MILDSLGVVAVKRRHVLAVIVVDAVASSEAQPVCDACVEISGSHHSEQLAVTVEILKDECRVVAVNPVFRRFVRISEESGEPRVGP